MTPHRLSAVRHSPFRSLFHEPVNDFIQGPKGVSTHVAAMGFECRLGFASHKQHFVAGVCALSGVGALSGRGRIPCSPVAVPLSHRFLLDRRQLPPESRAALRSIRMTHPAVSLARQFAPLTGEDGYTYCNADLPAERTDAPTRTTFTR